MIRFTSMYFHIRVNTHFAENIIENISTIIYICNTIIYTPFCHVTLKIWTYTALHEYFVMDIETTTHAVLKATEHRLHACLVAFQNKAAQRDKIV